MKKNLMLQLMCAAFLPCYAVAEAPAKAVKFAEKEYDLDTGVVDFKFGNGETVSVNVDELPADMQRNLMFHGMVQKGGDSYAGAKGNYSEAIESVRSVIEQLQAGSWKAGRGEGEARPRLGELAEAISRVKEIDLETATSAVQAAAALEGTDEQKKVGAEKLKTWRAHPKIKAAIATIRAEKAQAELAKATDAGGELKLD